MTIFFETRECFGRRSSMKNEILEEIWKARETIEKSENGDMGKVFEKARENTQASERRKYLGHARKKRATEA
jgi:hypothetical protein